mgnify:FL=1
MNSEKKHLELEWVTLQNNVEQSEALSLLIKLFSIIVCLIGIIFKLAPIILCLLLMVIWFQDAIWKTFQSRTEQRLHSIEAACNGDTSTIAFQFYSEWSAKRPGGIKLIVEYCKSAIRPTIAYPYVALVVIVFTVPYLSAI